MENSVDYDKLLFTGGNKKIYGFKNFRTLGKLIKSIYNRDMAIDEAEIKQNEFAGKIDELRAYSARVSKNIYLKESASKNTKKFYDRWEEIVNGFKNEILRFSKKVGMRTDSDDQQPNILDKPEQKRFSDFLHQIKEEQKKNMILFKEVFNYDTPDKMLQTSHDLKKIERYNQKPFLIENSVLDFGERVKKMFKGVDKNKEKEILKIVIKILDFCLNEWNQQGVGVKILTPSQILSRLPVSLAQLKARNISEKLKNEIRQLFFSLYTSKKLTKTSIKVLLTLFKDGNNFHEQRK